MTHRCAAHACTREISLALLMCPRHWKLVSRESQKAIYRTVNDKDRQTYYSHVADAIVAVRQKEKRGVELPAGSGGHPW